MLQQYFCLLQAKYTGLEALINENMVFSKLAESQHEHIINRQFLAQCDDITLLGLEYIPGRLVLAYSKFDVTFNAV